jgi:RNAse (barnase) inhibitor barstar
MDKLTARQELDRLWDSFLELTMFIDVNKLYFPVPTGKLLRAFIKSMNTLYRDLSGELFSEEDEAKEVRSDLRRQIDAFVEDVQQIAEQLEEEFRAILGGTQGPKSVA